MHRPYRIIGGVSYPQLADSKSQTKFIAATTDFGDREDYYHDEAIRLNDEEIKEFVGKPICFEHDTSEEFGVVSAAWKGSNGEMRFQARIYTDTPEGQEFFNDIDHGKNRGVSVGYSVSLSDDNRVTRKDIRELTICKEPFFSGAEVRVAASNGKNYNNSKTKFLLLKFSKMETPVAAAPLTQTNQDANELAKIHDQMLRENEAMREKLKALEAAENKLKLYEEAEKKSLADYAERRKPLLQEVLEINKEQHKAENGPDAQLPEDYVSSLEQAFLHPEGEKNAQVIMASARSWKKERERAAKEREELLLLKADVQKLKDDNAVASAHVEASKRLHLTNNTNTEETKQNIDISASSGKKLTMSNLFAPGAGDRLLHKQMTGRDLDVNVAASSAAKSSSVPLPYLNPAYADKLRNAAAFNKDGGARLQQFLSVNASKYSRSHMNPKAQVVTEVKTLEE